MKILNIKLEGYKLFPLKPIKYLEYKPNKKLQLILGTNGSGKSSLLKELFPTTPELTQEFYSKGFKEITLEHNNSIFILKSSINNKKIIHSFIKDGKELNNTGKKNIQTILIEEHFNMDTNFKNILLGIETFTSMSPSKRKEILIKMSNINFNFIYNIFHKVKNEERDIKSNIKFLNNKILLNKDKILEDKDKEELEFNISIYKEVIDWLLENKEQSIKKYDIKLLLEKINDLTIKINNILEKDNDLKYDKLNNLLIKLESIYNNKKEEKNKLYKKYSELEENILKIKSIKFNSLEELKKEKNDLLRKKEKLLKDLPFDINNKINTYNTILNNIKDILILSINNLPETDYELYNLKNFNKITNSLNELNKTLLDKKELLNKLNVALDKIDHLQKCNKVTCPKCSTTFLPGYDLTKHNSYKANYNKTKKEIDNLTILKEKYENFLSNFKIYKDNLNNILILKNKYKDIDNFFNWLLEDCNIEDFYFNYNSLKNKINLLNIKYLSIINDLDNINIKIEDLNKEHIFLENNDKLEIFEEEYNKIKNDLYKINNLLKTLELKINNIKNKINLSKKLIDYKHELNIALRGSQSFIETRKKEICNEVLIDIINKLRIDLNNFEHKLINNNKIIKILEEDIKDYKNLEDNKNIINILKEELSPDKGLIADTILSFINKFISNINNIIENIWEYQMELVPINMKNGDLDYLFPVQVSDTHLVSDISKVSSSMKEVIDLAFKLVFMKYMKLDNYPLYLDEFGRTMDGKHQDNAFRIIEKLINSNIPQIFLISHYENCYGRFTNADINILDDTNININNINNNLIIK